MREIRIPGVRRVFHLWTRSGIGRDVDEEIQFHLETRARELVQLGVSEREARRRALEEFGDVERSRRELRRVDLRRLDHTQREERLMSFIDDVRYAARGLLKRPALLLATTTALCIGISANATIFGVVDQLLLRPPAGVAEPEAVRRVYLRTAEEDGHTTQPITSYPLIPALQQGVPAFDRVAAFYRTTYSMGRGESARNIDVELVSGNYFDLLGVGPAMGRGFAPGEDTVPRGARVAVVSHGLWRGALGARADIVGETLHVAGDDYTIIGVAPKGFSGINRQNVDAWIPISARGQDELGTDWYSDAGNWWVQAIGRLGDGASEQLATAQATAVLQQQTREWGLGWLDTTGTIVLGSLIGNRAPDGPRGVAKVSLWLMAVSVIVLLIACANVANLLIARALDRRREIGVRLALGVSRGRLIRMLLTEAALLALFAALVSIAVSYWGSRLVQTALLSTVVWDGSILDLRVMAFTLGVTIVCMLLAGLAPALQSLDMKVSDSLTSASARVAGQRGGTRAALLGLQAALSIVLLIGAGLFVRSLHNVSERDVGIDLDRVLRVTMDLDEAGFDSARIVEIYEIAAQRLRRMPAVEYATVVRGTVPMFTANAWEFNVPGVEPVEIPGGGPYEAGITHEFLPTLGARIVSGRNFRPEEIGGPSRVVLVNEIVADAYWPGGQAVGECVVVDNDQTCTEVVGIVENVMLFAVVRDDRALVYYPASHPFVARRLPSALLVRTRGEGKDMVAAIGKEVQSLFPNMPYVNARPYSELVAPQLGPWRLGATMFTLFGAIALVIAAVGMYSVMAYLVSQRKQEIGVRMALGAQGRDIVKMVAWQTSRAVLVGLLLGGLAAAYASKFLGDLLYETPARDPIVYGTAAGALVIAALLASIVPARKSTAIDPALALRAD